MDKPGANFKREQQTDGRWVIKYSPNGWDDRKPLIKVPLFKKNDPITGKLIKVPVMNTIHEKTERGYKLYYINPSNPLEYKEYVPLSDEVWAKQDLFKPEERAHFESTMMKVSDEADVFKP